MFLFFYFFQTMIWISFFHYRNMLQSMNFFFCELLINFLLVLLILNQNEVQKDGTNRFSRFTWIEISTSILMASQFIFFFIQTKL